MKKFVCLFALVASSLSAQVPRLKPAEQSIVNEQDVPVGIEVRVGDLKMSLTAPHRGPTSAPGLPSVISAQDPRDRDEFIRSTGGVTFAELHYSKRDYLESVSIGNGYRLEFTDPDNGKVTETLRDGTGKVIHTGTTNAMVDRTSRVMGLCLDMVASDLGLGPDWLQHVRFTQSESGRMTTVSDELGAPLLYVLIHRGIRVAYLPNGQALFYDVPLVTSGKPRVQHADSDVGDSPMGFMNGVAMSRIQVAADGRVCAYTMQATLGSVMSFWITHDAKGRPVYGYRKAGSPNESHAQVLPAPASGPAAETARGGVFGQ